MARTRHARGIRTRSTRSTRRRSLVATPEGPWKPPVSIMPHALVHPVAFVIALALATYLHMLIGEMVP
ncbi:hypothetical protein AB0420_20335, partial [Streptomyces caelestis]|uniref:hypothetical protein n=1 Tax=Streptomyces caelestis TaxID=36816 RepID=UPI00344C8783